MMRIWLFSCLVAAGCGLDNSAKTACMQTSDCLDGYACIEQQCVIPGDAGVDATDPPDAPGPDAPSCTAESNVQFCARWGVDCNAFTAEDNCGAVRSVNCGTCEAPEQCGSSNVCGCEPESDAELCTAATAECGSVQVTDRCGATRTITCADTCSGGEACGGGWAPNTCGTTICTGDGWCRPSEATISQYFDFNGVWLSSATKGFAAGFGEFAGGGHVYYWNGSVWRRVATVSNRSLHAVTGSGPNDAWIGGGYGFVYRYDGSTLTSTSAGCVSCDVFDMWALGPQDVWGTGYDHKAMHFDGSGWSVTTTYPVPDAPRAVWASAFNDVWIVGDNGRMRHFNGADWTASQVGTVYFKDVWGRAANDVWAVGAGGAIYHYNGMSWTPVASNTTQTLRAVSGTAANQVWFAGDNGVILYWNGSTVAVQNSGTSRAINALHAMTPTDIWAVGEGGLLLHKQQ